MKKYLFLILFETFLSCILNVNSVNYGDLPIVHDANFYDFVINRDFGFIITDKNDTQLFVGKVNYI